MKILIDADVAKVAEFMMRSIPGTRLQPVACAVARLANCLWSEYYDGKQLMAFEIERDQIFGVDQVDPLRQQLASSAPDPAIAQPSASNGDDRCK